MKPTGVLAAFLLLATVGCIRRETVTVEVTPDVMREASDLRTATNLPSGFTVVTPAATPGDCPPQLRDPGLRTSLLLRRSAFRPVQDSTTTGYRAMGDYAVDPPGLYGEEPGEGLRIDCAQLRAIGVVRL